MKVTEAFNFMKLIIKNGKSKRLSVGKVKGAINDYINVLISQKCLSKVGIRLLYGVSLRIDDIMHDIVTPDEVFVNMLSTMEDTRDNKNITFSEYAIHHINPVDKCGVSILEDQEEACGVSMDSCGVATGCGSKTLKYDCFSDGSSSSACGSTSCGRSSC